MLDWNQVLYFIKGRLSLPSAFIEKSDPAIREWVTTVTIPLFSEYIPDWERSVITPSDPLCQTERQNQFRFFDAEDLTIIGTKNFYSPSVINIHLL